VPQYQRVPRFSEQPPKLGVARSNRARVTIIIIVQCWNVMFRVNDPLDPWFDKAG
jgi:hypothetical protein